jgi:hypothetical protein
MILDFQVNKKVTCVSQIIYNACIVRFLNNLQLADSRQSFTAVVSEAKVAK